MLVICPPKLVPMWQWHIAQYRIAGAAMSLGRVIEELAPIVAAGRALDTGAVLTAGPPGAITYLRFPDGTDAMVRVDQDGGLVSQSLAATFRAVACGPDTPALPKAENHHDLVAAALEAVLQEQGTFSGQLGSLRSTRRQVYERLKRCREAHQRRPTLFSQPFLDGLPPTLDALLRYPLKDTARSALTRQLRLGINDDGLADMVMRIYVEDRLVTIIDTDDETPPDPQIVCSMGLLPTPAETGANQ